MFGSSNPSNSSNSLINPPNDDASKQNSIDHRSVLNSFLQHGNHAAVAQYLRQLFEQEGDECLDGHLPSLLHYYGVSLYNLGDLPGAAHTFKMAVQHQDADCQSWMHLGETLLQQWEGKVAAVAFENAALRAERVEPNGELLLKAYAKLYKARSWQADWYAHELLADRIRLTVERRIAKGLDPLVSASEFPDASSRVLRKMLEKSHHASIHVSKLQSPREIPQQDYQKKLKLGFISSDFGVHPVATLIRGVIQRLSRHHQNIEVHCYALTRTTSWWARNISAEAHSFLSLHGKSTSEAARQIWSDGVHILIDLNGHTQGSGLPILAYRPAPIQVSFLGLPGSTGCSFVDFVIADWVSVRPTATDTDNQFTERLLLLPPTYIPTDYAQLQGHTVWRPRAHLENLTVDQDIQPDEFIFGCFSNFQKMDPVLFKAWANILQRVQGSKLLLMKHKLHDVAADNLRMELAAHGLASSRIVFADQAPWIEHTWQKTAVDLALDTRRKSGHTTSLDALWAGIPLITIEGQAMSQRAGVAMLESLELSETVVHSLKEYEDLAVLLALNPSLLNGLRQRLKFKRPISKLFNTNHWTDQFLSSLQVLITIQSSDASRHIFIPHSQNKSIKPLELHSAAQDGENERSSPEKLAEDQSKPLKLHIGGMEPHVGWTLIDVKPRPGVDYVLDMKNLEVLHNSSVSAIYISHVLEHASYGVHDPEVAQALEEFHRVLKPGGVLLVSVPDLSVLAALYTNKTLTSQERFTVMRMIFGGQTDSVDYHKVGFDEEVLTAFLSDAGFCEIQRIKTFGLFNDSSMLHFKGQPVSLNIMCKACHKEGIPLRHYFRIHSKAKHVLT